MAVQEGKAAPAFTLADDEGKKVSLKDLSGKDVILYFYPKDDTPGCTKEACGFRDGWKELKKLGVVVLGVSPDSAQSHQKFRSKYKLPFTLLSDPDKKVMEKYGAFGEKMMYGKKVTGVIRSTVWIGPGRQGEEALGQGGQGRGASGAGARGAPGRPLMSRIRFPDGFHWGTATASYQIEGSWDADGKGESIWDRFSHTPGKIKNGDTGDVACDSYRRWQDDIALMKELGHTSYRFSLSWPRIQPTGRGAPNSKGLDHYRRFIDALLAAGIRPFPTLYHWDLPQALEDDGGWPNRDLAGRFSDYAEIVAKALGERVQHWILLNEPNIFTTLGYLLGYHAPGRRDMEAFLRATHTVNLAQGMAFRAMKAALPKASVGTAFNMSPCEPESDSAADAAAAERWHAFINDWFVSTALRGRYPDAFVGETPLDRMGVRDGDMALVRAELDFIGINLYSRTIVRAVPGDPNSGRHGDREPGRQPGAEDRLRLGGLARLAAGHDPARDPRLREASDRGDGERLLLRRCPGRQGSRERHPAHRVLPGLSRRRGRGHRQGSRRARLPRVDAPRQLRVGGGHEPALRLRVRRFREAEADHQGVRKVVRWRGRRERLRSLGGAPWPLRARTISISPPSTS